MPRAKKEVKKVEEVKAEEYFQPMVEDEKMEEPKHHMKRWEIYSLVALLVVIIAAGIYGAYYYVENVDTNPEAVTDEISVERTDEEADLDQIKKDLESDASLDMTDVDNELKELDAIDLSGV